MTSKAPAHLYLLKDGTYADPKDCKVRDGELRHENGVGVALKADGQPMTLGDVAAENIAAIEAAATGEQAV